MPSNDIYGDAGLIQYTYNNHTWLELKNGVHLSEKGQGGFNYASAFMVLPGSGHTAVKCYVDMYVFVRVNEDLDCQMKIVPGNVIADGCSGLYFPRVVPVGTEDNCYPSIMVTYPHDFRLMARRGMSDIDMTQPNQTTIILRNTQDQASNRSRCINILKSWYGKEFAAYGIRTFDSVGYRYHWRIGLGRNAGNEGTGQRYSGGSLTSAWKSSPGWFYVGNLEDDFDWSEDQEEFDGYIYFCGIACYPNFTSPATAIPKKVTIPGLKRLLDYYPWAIRKGSTWKSCNRAEGYLKSREGSSWKDRKNRMD